LNSTLLKKVFWPGIVAIAAFMILGAFTAPKANAGEVVEICGPEIINEGDTVIYIAQIDDIDVDGNPADNDGIFEGDEVEVDLDDNTGNSDITSELRYVEEDDEWQYVELDDETDFLSGVWPFAVANSFTTDSQDFDDIIELLEDISDDFDLDPDLFLLGLLEECGTDEEGFAADVEDVILECITDEGPFFECVNDWTESDDEDADLTFPNDVGISPTEIAEALAEYILDNPDSLVDCDLMFEFVDEFLVDEGVSPVISEDIAQDVFDLCEDGAFLGDVEAFVLIDVTCQEAGTFDLSFEPQQSESEPGQIEVQCVGDVDDAEIDANPTTVEIVPARGSTSASLVTLNLLDENGDPAGEGTTVVWTTDRCRLSADGLEPDEDDPDANMVEEALEVFGEYNKNLAQTALDINVFVDELDQDTRTSVEADAFALSDDAGDFDEGDIISAVILDCSATATTPGIAKVMACIDVEGADICKTVNVTVVGPPVAPIVLTTDQTNVRCGERVQITATIKDAAGQNVSDHTLVEVATNAGGVLGGTGAIAGEAGLVSPVSSTVAETNNGVTTFWLITSELHQGTYTVLVTTGGGGSVAGQLLGGLFSTPPVSGSVTVTCGPATAAPSAPSPAATVRPPSTGQGITPPSTGDAGLADASGGSWALFVIAGLTVFALAGVASFKVARR